MSATLALSLRVRENMKRQGESIGTTLQIDSRSDILMRTRVDNCRFKYCVLLSTSCDNSTILVAFCNYGLTHSCMSYTSYYFLIFGFSDRDHARGLLHFTSAQDRLLYQKCIPCCRRWQMCILKRGCRMAYCLTNTYGHD